MKKLIILFVFVCGIAGYTHAQRCLPGMRGIEMRGGMTDGKLNGQNFNVGLAMTVYTHHANKWIFAAEYLQKGYDYETGTIPKAQITGEAGYYLNVLSSRNKIFFLSIGLSGVAGYETTNWGTDLLPDGARLLDGDNFIYGGAVGARIETYITDRFVLVLSCRERILFGSSIGNFHNQLNVGFRFIIN